MTFVLWVTAQCPCIVDGRQCKRKVSFDEGSPVPYCWQHRD